MNDTSAKVVSIESVSGKYRRIILQTGWGEWIPGQFVMVRVPANAVLVRRPFGIVGLKDGRLELCFKVIGQGTRVLSHVVEGERLDVLGPLGNGFAVASGGAHVLVAGGYGIAPILGLARRLISDKQRVNLFYGAKNKDHLLYLNELKKLSIELHLATEDGSEGRSGVISDVVAAELSSMREPTIYACGPKPLLGKVAQLSKKHDVTTQVSLDEYMACGLGVCLGCMVKLRDGTNVRACREGPVFNTDELVW